MQDRSAVRKATVHYNGGNAVITFDIEQYLRVVAGMNDSYWSSRGYALGYNWGLSPGGHLVFIRGLDIRCAANGCQEANVPATAIQVLTATPTTDMTPQQADALENKWIPWLRVQYQNRLEVHVIGHRDINPICSNATGTICPGVKIYPRIQANVFDAPSLTPPPSPGDDEEMSTLIASSDGTAEQKNQWFLLVGGQPHVLPTNQTRVDVVAMGTVNGVIKSQNQQPFRNLTVSDIQQLINLNWSGPRGSFATVGGYTIPADPAVAAIGNGVKPLATTVHLQAVQDQVNKIPTTPGSGSGASVAQIEGVIVRQDITLDLSAEKASVALKPATP
jgi:hypothetical protein